MSESKEKKAEAKEAKEQKALTKLEEVRQALLKKGEMTRHEAHVMEGMLKEKSPKLIEVYETYPGDEQSEQLKSHIKGAMIDKLEEVWNTLFADCSTSHGKKLSKNERAALGVNKASLVYGEVSFNSFGTVVWGPFVNLKSGGIFYDLGSGTGRGVFCAALLHDFKKCVGIEILESLHKASGEVLERFNKEMRPKLSESQKAMEISMKRASFLDLDWSDADLVFANSTCFDEDLVNEIGKCAEKLKEGAYVITLTKRLNSPCFKLLDSTQYTMSWGYATVHVHRRLPQGQTADSTDD
jgi:SAM-dependent methyltransferase